MSIELIQYKPTANNVDNYFFFADNIGSTLSPIFQTKREAENWLSFIGWKHFVDHLKQKTAQVPVTAENDMTAMAGTVRIVVDDTNDSGM